jgi:hypothetical protein
MNSVSPGTDVIEKHERPDRALLQRGIRRRTRNPPPRSLLCALSVCMLPW